MSCLCKKLDSLGTEIGLMEMMLAGVKCALTGQPFRLPQELRIIAATQEAVGWTQLSKGRMSRQWIKRQCEHIGDKATTKTNALNWATAVIDYFFTQWLKVWDQRNLDRHGHDVSGPVVRPTDETHTRCITNGYLRMKHDRGRCNGIGMISRGSLNKS